MRKGISPTVSFVLIVAIILIATVVSYFWAAPIVSGLGEPGRINNLKNQMVSLDYMIRATAHGETNYTNIYEMYLPNAYIELNPENDTLALTFIQKALVIGRRDDTANMDCAYDAETFYDNNTGISLSRELNLSRVYSGSKGEGGETEVLICYTDIDLKFEGSCSRVATGAPRVVAYIKKEGMNASTSKPLVSVTFC